ncbi:MAG: hypothetical protein KJO43_06210 [Phycisphaerae bacterium]|nr:hypothetical protein [Phycisphaerae bacterium]
MRTMMNALTTVTMTAIAMITGPALGQIQPLDEFAIEIGFDSGFVVNDGVERAVVYETIVEVPAAAWIRLAFATAELGVAPDGGADTILRVTALRDGGTQHHTATTLAQWQDTTAYFNGGTLHIEIEADPGAAASRIIVNEATVGPLVPSAPAADTICGTTDDRQLSDDPRAGRLVPIGCTAWLIDDANHCFLTAGHCAPAGSGGTMEFNVPLSTGGGALQHPGPEDQYAIDPTSMQSNGGQGIGNDWAYFGCFPNTETGLTPVEAQGDFFVLSLPPAVGGQDIRITGYGTTSSPVPPQWNQVQKTHAGPYASFAGSAVAYTTDTTGGNSGSPVINESTGFAIGIHTHGGCGAGGGANNGTGNNNSGLQNALENPTGVCIPVSLLGFDYPDGLPEMLDPSGDTIRVEVSALDGGRDPLSGTGMLHYDAGAGVVSVPMVEVATNVYDAVFPALTCGSTVSYFFTAETVSGMETSDPQPGVYTALVATSLTVAFADDFESDLGWTVENIDLDDGAWERGVPIGGGDRGDPADHFDGSGNCYLTDNVDDNSDVDGGPTRLISPALDTSGLANPHVRYARWFTNDDGDEDRMDVHLSSNDGASWTLVESVPDTAGWVERTVAVADFVEVTDSVRVRFSATDNPNNSVTEGGIDGIAIVDIGCGKTIPGDVDGDGDVDFTDLLAVISSWGPCVGCPADINGDGVVDFTDLLILLAAWT